VVGLGADEGGQERVVEVDLLKAHEPDPSNPESLGL
jgi:hypothetical protein